MATQTEAGTFSRLWRPEIDRRDVVVETTMRIEAVEFLQTGVVGVMARGEDDDNSAVGCAIGRDHQQTGPTDVRVHTLDLLIDGETAVTPAPADAPLGFNEWVRLRLTADELALSCDAAAQGSVSDAVTTESSGYPGLRTSQARASFSSFVVYRLGG